MTEYEDVTGIDYEIDIKQVIKQTIDNTFEFPWQNIEEGFDNSIDAQANFITMILNKRTRQIDIDDNGEGIGHPKDVYVFGGTKKRLQKAANPERRIHGEFGEGVKTCLSMCDELAFESNNGNFDSYLLLKYPKRNNKEVSYKTRPKGSIRPDIGTTLRLINVDPNKLENVCENLDQVAEKYSAKLALQDVKIRVVIIEEDNSKKDFFLKAPEKIAKLFEQPVQKIRATDPLIEFIGVPNKERKILICNDWIVIKEIIPNENVFGIANCNAVKVTRDRKSIVTNDTSRCYFTELKSYTSTHYEKASSFDNMKEKEKADFTKMLRKLNELADFLKPQILPPTFSSKGLANSTTDVKTKYLRTPKANPHGVKILPGQELYVRAREKSDEAKPEEGKITSTVTEPPTTNFEKSITDILVKRTVVRGGKEATAIALQVEDINKNRHEQRLNIEFLEYQDNDSVVIPTYDSEEGKASLHINTSTEFHWKIYGTPQYWKSLTPMFAEGFEVLRLMAEGKEQIEPVEFLRRVGKTLNDVWGVWK